MAAKIAVLTLLVIICKVQSQVQYPYSQSCSIPTSTNNAQNQGSCNTQLNQPQNVQSQVQYPYSQSCSVPTSTNNAQNQGSCNTQLNQPQNIQIKPSNLNNGINNGIKASPQLKIVPGQRCNLQAIPLSQYTGSNFQRNQPQNCGCDCNPQNIQVNPVSQVPSSAQLQPYLCGPSSVITSPVSSISIPPTGCTTIIDNSLSNSLVNALVMLIANEFMNGYSNNNNNQDCCQIPLAEAIPGFDFAGLLQSLNAKQCGQVTNQIVTVPCQDTNQYPTSSQCQTPSQCTTPNQYPTSQCTTPNQYPTSQCTTPNQYPTSQCTTPNYDCNTPVTTSDWSNLLLRLQDTCQYGTPQTEWDKVKCFLDKQNQQAVTPSQNINNCQTQDNCPNNYILEAIAAYLGCDKSEVCSNALPTVSEIYFPEEIPAQLICNYGYMPTTVPVIEFNVKPLTCEGESGSNFVIGC